MTQQGLTKIEGVPDRAQAVPGMAHFAGSGPAGQQCKGCVHIQRCPTPRELYRCKKYRHLTGKIGATISSTCAACKYFEQKV